MYGLPRPAPPGMEFQARNGHPPASISTTHNEQASRKSKDKRAVKSKNLMYRAITIYSLPVNIENGG